jgi:hypothetical protein
MAKEIDWQRHIIKRVREEGGYGKKWSSSFTVGPPDLILALPGFGALFVEVKLEKGWSSDTARTIDFSEKQKEEAQQLNAAGARCIGLVVIYGGPQNVNLAPVAMPPPREKLRVRLSDLRKNEYSWRTRGGPTTWGRFDGPFIEWLKLWYNQTNGDTNDQR